MRGISRTSRAAVGALVAATVFFGAAASTDAAPPEKYQLTVSDDQPGAIHFGVTPAMPSEPGVYKLGLANNSFAPHVMLVIGGLDEGTTVADFEAIVDSVERDGNPPPEGTFVVSAIFVKPGQDHQKNTNLTEGTYGFFCPIGPEDPAAPRHYEQGFIGVFDVAD